MEQPPPSPLRHQKGWFAAAVAGFAVTMAALIVVAAVIADKEDFGALVGPYFLEWVTGAIITGAVLLAAGTWRLREPRAWRRYFLFGWAALAVLSPLSGLLFVLPWLALIVTSPVVAMILFARERRPAQTAVA